MSSFFKIYRILGGLLELLLPCANYAQIQYVYCAVSTVMILHAVIVDSLRKGSGGGACFAQPQKG